MTGNHSSPARPSVTRTAETVKAYQEAARKIERMARRDLMRSMPGSVVHGKPLTPMQLAAWHIERMKRGEISSSTYRSYKASLICAFETITPDHEETPEAIEFLRTTEHVRGLKPVIKKASARKSKQIDFADLVKLCDWLNAHRGKFNYLAAMWLFCAYHTGLRPVEWEKAGLVGEGPDLMLRVVNAKNTNGRSHGVYRHVPLGHLDTYSRESIIAFLHLLTIEMDAIPFQDIKHRVRLTIYRASRLCFSKRRNGISLYTMRHQFSANTKATLSLQETGALMGHKLGDTSKINYARAITGNRVEGLYALQNEVDRVQPPSANPWDRRQDELAAEAARDNT